MSPSVSTFVSILAVALCAAAANFGRQGVSSQATTLRALASDGTDLGALTAPNGDDVSVSVSNSTTGSVFTLTSGTLFIDRNPSDDIFPPPNAVIEFDETATGCGPTGPLMITRLPSGTCAVSGFSFSGDVLEADVSGTFEVCGSQLFYTTSSGTPDCTTVEIVKGPVPPL